jgi:SAM-dependent methyltransferase
VTPQALRAALASGDHLPDGAFDALYPDELRARSELQWTAVPIAVRAAALLGAKPGEQILDVGCGVGKLCLIARLLSPDGVAWWGVDHEAALIDAANHAAWQLGLRDDVRFVHAEAWDIDWSRFDAFYFFNPFPALPDTPGNAFQKYGAFVQECARAEDRLAALRPGTRVVTYHGFGGDMPACFELAGREAAGTDELQLWLRR